MATWIIVGGVVLFALILGGALLVVMIATRERTRPVRLPGFHRVVSPSSGDEQPPGGADRS